MTGRADLTDRLWRVRRRHHHIDAALRKTAAGWRLEFLRNDRPMVVLPFEHEADARREADRRLRELQRAGWTVHW